MGGSAVTELGRALLDQLGPDDLDRLAALLAPRLADVDLQDATDPGPLLTCAEAARRSGCHVETIRRAARSGALSNVRAGRSLRIRADDLEAWLSRSRTPGRTARRQRATSSRTIRRPMRDALAGVSGAPIKR